MEQTLIFLVLCRYVYMYLSFSKYTLRSDCFLKQYTVVNENYMLSTWPWILCLTSSQSYLSCGWKNYGRVSQLLMKKIEVEILKQIHTCFARHPTVYFHVNLNFYLKSEVKINWYETILILIYWRFSVLTLSRTFRQGTRK